MIYIPSFIKIGSGIQRLTAGIHRQHGDRISLFGFLQSNESILKTDSINIFIGMLIVAQLAKKFSHGLEEPIWLISVPRYFNLKVILSLCLIKNLRLRYILEWRCSSKYP
jgi:hypothetical protein